MSEKTTKDMRWHNMGLTKDGKLRHLANGPGWKAFDARYPKFASDPRSVWLGLASDGFNPFRMMSTSYITWPVMLIPYNLLHWICMKQQFLILSSIIPGGKAPRDDIDIYLIPLIKELKFLCDVSLCVGVSYGIKRVARPFLFLPSKNQLLWHRYAISSLMDTAYRLSEQYLEISSFKLQNTCLLA
ncbi:hypothetical protein Tco_1070311 [Tanacetum coccineum]|uniref:Uncharacterized protein n=1 Tax=Tanacetum coccineum TaxID=301880 RepID=A0ABQ5HM60_9ASTR